MIRTTLNKIFSSKVFYIVFSLLVSIALWMFVEINENQTVHHQVTGIPVVSVNAEILSDRNLLITDMRPETVTLTFECPRSVASKLTRDALSAEIDLSTITERGYATLPYEIKYPPGVDEESSGIPTRLVSRISLYIDRMSQKSVPVDVPYTGGAAEDYICDQPEFGPRDVIVFGPAEILAEIFSAKVQINRESLSTTLTEYMPFVLLDREGEPLDEELLAKLTFSEELIHVTIPVRMVREVALVVDFAYGSGATPQNTNYYVDPPMITIAGDPEDLRDFNSISLSTIDLTRFEYSDTYVFTIPLPNHLTNISGEREAQVLVEVLGVGIKYITVLSPSIHVTGEQPGYIVDIWTQSVDVRLRGRQEDLDNVTEANLTVVAALPAEMGIGTQRVVAKVNINGIDADVGAIAATNYYLIVNIQRE